MSTVGRPEIGQWYERTDRGELFQVTALDEHEGTIELQLFNGDVDELDAETWSGLPLERADSPEDRYPPSELDEIEQAPWRPGSLNDPAWLERLA